MFSADENVTTPYWDWTAASDINTGVDSRSSEFPLWDNSDISLLSWNDNFLDSYNSILNYSRILGGGWSLPTSTDIIDILGLSSFSIFTFLSRACKFSAEVG